MNAPPTFVDWERAFPPADSPVGRLFMADMSDPRQQIACEEAFYRSFKPVLEINPLIADLWDWDHAAYRLRPRIPAAALRWICLSPEEAGPFQFITAVNTDLTRHWQAEPFGFPRPVDAPETCEFIMMARDPAAPPGLSVLTRRHYVRAYLLDGLRRVGYSRVYATTADHLRALYRWLGAECIGERIHAGHRRTLLAWTLSPPEPNDGQHGD